MSNDSLYRQVYDGIVNGMQLQGVNFQLSGTPRDFVFNTPPIGQMDPAAYQIVSGMPLWSAVGNFSYADARLIDAVRSVLGHVTFKLSPEQMQDQATLQNLVTARSNDVVKANGNMNQAYLAAKQNGGLIFASRYPDVNAWLANAPEAATYIAIINNANTALREASDRLLDLQQAAMPPELKEAREAMRAPTGDPASSTAPAGWTKVPGGDGILRWQPEFQIGDTGTDWRARLSQGSAGAFTVDLSQSDNSADFSHSWANGTASFDRLFWGVSAGGGWDRSDMFSQDSSVKVKVSVQSSARVKVTPGDWYPGGFLSELAKSTQGPTGQGFTITQPWVAKGGPGSSSLFGQYGLASARVSELIVVYKPSFEITMSSNTYQQNKQKFEASAGLRIGPFSFGGSGGHESEFTRNTAQLNTFSGGSTSEDPQIIGVVVSFPGTNEA